MFLGILFIFTSILFWRTDNRNLVNIDLDQESYSLYNLVFFQMMSLLHIYFLLYESQALGNQFHIDFPLISFRFQFSI